MKLKYMLPVLVLGTSTNMVFAADSSTPTPAAAPVTAPAPVSSLTSEQDKISYSIGVDLGRNLKQQDISLTDNLFLQGLHDGMEGEPKLLNKDQVIDTLKKLQKQLADRREAYFKKVAETNKQKGEEFLAANKSKSGVVTLPSGLQYKILEEGTGASPKPTDIVTTHYKGTLIDGTEFDSSYKRGVPATFPVNGVIPGWVEALQLMKAGAKWQLFIPASLAYGEQGAGPEIGPNETLLFEVSLLSFKSAADESKGDTPADEKAKSDKPKKGGLKSILPFGDKK